MTRKAATFWPVMLTLLVGDWTTKELAVGHLVPPYLPHNVMGDVVRFTLAYNPGAAFSMSLGAASRWGFTVLALIALGTLGAVYRSAADEDRLQAIAIALVAGGALGNLLDRIRSARGVVDFIDIGFGDRRFWTCNVADMGVTCGAILLAWVLWKRSASDQDTLAVAAPDAAPPPSPARGWTAAAGKADSGE